MKNIVVIAHDVKKPELVQFINEHKDWIFGVNLIATGRTAEYLESQGIKVEHLSPGRSGGYSEITDRVKQNEIDIVIFLRDPLIKVGHHEDIQALLKHQICIISLWQQIMPVHNFYYWGILKKKITREGNRWITNFKTEY